jgi:hypothetical protein
MVIVMVGSLSQLMLDDGAGDLRVSRPPDQTVTAVLADETYSDPKRPPLESLSSGVPGREPAE